MINEFTTLGPIHFIRSSRAKRISISIRGTKVRVAVPVGVPMEKAKEFVLSKQDWILKHLKKFNALQNEYQQSNEDSSTIGRFEAKKLLISKLETLAEKHGFSYNRVFVKNQKTLWGSCSAKKNINLNYKLILLPGELQEYVILHELVHLKHRNHSNKFWQELATYCTRYQQLRKELRKYRLEFM
ncbi:MAG TPA: M48 family peptidase [Candidatus Cloacimonetes bacterium]|nr:M48 family peptidase [Candidatus Cloacimonadota bacterium]HEX37652.1 M48 family peptidase [Candidatus Cloacimonadota bacterium]